MIPTKLGGLAAFLVLLPLASLDAQLTQPGQPTSDWADLRVATPTVTLPPVDVAELLAEDEVRGPFPLRYGTVIETDIGLDRPAGAWEGVSENGALVWRVRISSPGAYSLGVVFTEYDVPVGGQVFLYSDGKQHVFGAYTDGNNNVNGLLGIQPVPGDAVTIEYVQEAWAVGTPRLVIGEVVHDYKNVFRLLETAGTEDGGAEGGCGLVGINCPEGAPYQTVKRSVMRTLAGGGLCSAGLLNNTAGDGTPYMLTANHCGNMTSAQFLFNYEQLSCGTSFGSQSDVVSGAVKLASSSTYDSQLYRLNTNPPGGFQAYYAGWSRATTSGSPAATVGHGGGGPKNLAIDNSGASLTTSQWQVTWHVGYIIGGNSGGPLFNSANRVIGPACCVNTFTCGAQTAWYGRFDRFYTTSNLGQWLDPLGADPTSIDGFDPFAAPPSIASIQPSSVQVFAGGPVTLNGSGFLGTSKLKIGTTELVPPLGFTVVDDTKITFGAPKPASFTTVPVSVEKPSGTSNQVNLTYVATSPPKLNVTGVTVTGLGVVWDFGAQPNDFYFVLVKPNSQTTFPFAGFDLLANPLFLFNGSLSAIGIGHEGIVVSPAMGLAPGAVVYSQVLFLDDLTAGFAGATNVGATTILL